MRKYLFILLALITIHTFASDFYVTCSPHFTGTHGARQNVKARLGNQLLAYFKAQWAAEKYHLPYLHQHFDFDNSLNAGHCHKSFNSFMKKHPR
ncbi:MAG: hypothetical protein KAJ19_09225, partial [Gammaproteobacteria bacterium]|nr:hypothetical protein [Gammaproteobacteria bacterium]